jgi:hypothetical protein
MRLRVVPTGVLVYQGHFAFSNLSTAGSPLTEYNASGPPPPCAAPFGSLEYTFLPNSDKATVSYLGTSITWVANQTVRLDGYWVPSGSDRYTLQQFGPGFPSATPYTVVVFDSWGQQAIGYFYVASGIVTPVP